MKIKKKDLVSVAYFSIICGREITHRVVCK